MGETTSAIILGIITLVGFYIAFKEIRDRKDSEFYGFYRISLLPENKLEIHCGLTHFDSFLARRYLQVTELVLKELQEIFPKYAFTSECVTTHEKANNYLRYFYFELEDSKDGGNSYILNKYDFRQKFC